MANRYLNSYDTYESRLQALLDNGYEFEEATELAYYEDNFNNEFFTENTNTQEQDFLNGIVTIKTKKINNKNTVDDQRKKKNILLQKNENSENITLLTIIFFTAIFSWAFFLIFVL